MPQRSLPSAWIPGARLWRQGDRTGALRHLAIAALTLLFVCVCGWRLANTALPVTRADRLVAAVALILCATVVLRLLSWAADASQAGAAWWRQMRSHRLALLGSLLVALLVLIAALAPLLVHRAPEAFGDMTTTRYQPPGGAFLLGSDQFGRDVLTRLVYGARISLGVAFSSVLLTMILGTGVGLMAGYRGGWVDAVLMRVVDVLLAFPRIFLVLLVISLAEPSLWLVVGVLAVTGWMATARLVRSEVLSVREREYVQAARALGFPTGRIVLRHVLPNTVAPIVVSATLMIGNVILAESVLSFLGLGVPVPTPSWGAMIDEGRAVFPDVWWLATFPGLAITVTVVAFNLLGDGLRDAWDPRSGD